MVFWLQCCGWRDRSVLFPFVFFVSFLSNFIHLTSPFHLLSITPCCCHFWHHSLSLNPVLGTTKFWPVFGILVFVLNFLTLMMILFVFYLIHLESYSFLVLKFPLLLSPHPQAMEILPKGSWICESSVVWFVPLVGFIVFWEKDQWGDSSSDRQPCSPSL